MSNLATIETISGLSPMNADTLEVANVLGYKCVVPKGQYSVGDKVAFVRPDTVLPETDWAEPYRKYAKKRVKAIKIRDQWSEGIILVVPEALGSREVGEEVSDYLGITKYEPPLPNDLQARGMMPYGIPITDEERWENYGIDLPLGKLVRVTLKIDGQSGTFILGPEGVHACSRRLDLKLDAANNFTNVFDRYRLAAKLEQATKLLGVDYLAIRGEVYGNNIQKSGHNPHSKLPLGFAAFSLWLLKERQYLPHNDFVQIMAELDIPTVNMLEVSTLDMGLINKYALATDLDGTPFEGVVCQVLTPYDQPLHAEAGLLAHPRSFKIINKHYDSKKG